MKERLVQLMEAERVTSARFAQLLGVQRSSISHILSGRNKPSYDMIHAILSAFPKVSPDWLVLGKGSMYRRVVQASLFDAMGDAPETAAIEGDEQPTIGAQQANTTAQPEESATQGDGTHQPTVQPPAAATNDGSRRVERVMVFYTDQTFREYTPS